MDLKSFYASVECVDRGLDPLNTNLVVADTSRTQKTICLAVSPSLKAYGISGRARLFEVISKVREVNALRKVRAPGGAFTGKSSFADELQEHSELEVAFVTATPRMARYLEYSAQIYDIYLKYIAPEDIHVYSIDEVFLDVTQYLKTYGMTARELASKIAMEILEKKGLTATAGIGTNLYLCKIAMDIVAKHMEPDENGVRIAELDEMLLEEDTDCFCFLAGHESFAAAEGAIGIAEKANKVRQKPLRVILNGLGKDAAKIISRINGFTFVETSYDPYTNTVTEVERIAYSEGLRAKVNCYGANSVPEGVAIMWKENVDVSITGNSTNPTRFQHPVAGTYKKERLEAGKKYFSVASGGGTGRTLHPDNMAAGPASYGFTDTLGRMHSDAQFAGSSSVPAHVEMMGLIGMGNNPMVGATVAVAVSIEEAAKAGKF
jgi:hypothetical protein